MFRPHVSPWLLPGIFAVSLLLLCGVAFLLRAGLRTRNLAQCWRCGAAKVRPSNSRSLDMLAGMFFLRPYRCGGCLTRFYAFRRFEPALRWRLSPVPETGRTCTAPERKSPFRIRVKVIVRLPWPTDWKSAWDLLLAEEQGFLATPPDNRTEANRQRAREAAI